MKSVELKLNVNLPEETLELRRLHCGANPIARCLGTAALVLVIAANSHAANCNVDGVVYASSSSAPVDTATNGQFNGTVCGHTIYAPNGATCFLNISNDDSISSGDCLTVGEGVTIDGNDHTITCTGVACGDAIASSSLGSGNENIDALHVVGCFNNAFYGNPSARDLTNSSVDAPLSGCTLNNSGGVVAWSNIDRVNVSAKDYCFTHSGGAATISNSVARNCLVGLGTSSSVTLDNVLITDTTYRAIDGAFWTDLSSSVLINNAANCSGTVPSCFNFSGDSTMIDGEIYN